MKKTLIEVENISKNVEVTWNCVIKFSNDAIWIEKVEVIQVYISTTSSAKFQNWRSQQPVWLTWEQ